MDKDPTPEPVVRRHPASATPWPPFAAALVLLPFALLACSDGSSPTGPTPRYVELSKEEAWLVTGDTVRFSATVTDEYGDPIPEASVTFSSSDPEQASITSDGLVEAVEDGSVTITATAGDASTSAEVEVRPGGGQRVPELAVVDQLLMEFLERWEIPGGAVGVTYNGRLVLLRGYGLADREAEEPMSPDARFRLASLSKPLTALATLKLVEDGALDLHDRAFEILDDLEPPEGETPDPRLRDIRVRHLLHHLGGWDRSESGDWTWPPYVQQAAEDLGIEGPPSAEEVLRWVIGRPLDFDPGERYAYSNIGYSTLARIVERVTGRDYEDFVREELLIPAGAEGTRLGGTFLEDRLEGEVRYHDSGTTQSVFPDLGTVPWAYGGFSLEARDGQGGWVSSAADYLRFVHAVDGRPERQDVVAPETVDWINTRPQDPVFADETSWYSGFRVRPQSGGHFWSHGGSLPGTRTLLIHRPDGVSYVVLLNSRGTSSSDARSELGTLLGNPLREVSEWPDHDLF